MNTLDSKMQELQDRLRAIAQIVDRIEIDKLPVINFIYDRLNKIRSIARSTEESLVNKVERKKLDHIIISCDASIKKNPGGQASAGFVIQIPDKKPIKNAILVPGTTSNQAEYDAIYSSLQMVFGILKPYKTQIEVRSDSLLVIRQLCGDWECKDKKLKRRRDMIWQSIDPADDIGVTINFQWFPRNSTPELEEANFLAQDLLSIPRH